MGLRKSFNSSLDAAFTQVDRQTDRYRDRQMDKQIDVSTNKFTTYRCLVCQAKSEGPAAVHVSTQKTDLKLAALQDLQGSCYSNMGHGRTPHSKPHGAHQILNSHSQQASTACRQALKKLSS